MALEIAIAIPLGIRSRVDRKGVEEQNSGGRLTSSTRALPPASAPSRRCHSSLVTSRRRAPRFACAASTPAVDEYMTKAARPGRLVRAVEAPTSAARTAREATREQSLRPSPAGTVLPGVRAPPARRRRARTFHPFHDTDSFLAACRRRSRPTQSWSRRASAATTPRPHPPPARAGRCPHPRTHHDSRRAVSPDGRRSRRRSPRRRRFMRVVPFSLSDLLDASAPRRAGASSILVATTRRSSIATPCHSRGGRLRRHQRLRPAPRRSTS